MYKHIPLTESTMNYPVGLNIQQNIPIIKQMAKLLKLEYPKKTLVFWVRGSSGAMIAAMISGFLRGQECVIHYVRKSGEDSHGGSDYRQMGNAIHVIVDDFMSTGSTIRIIYNELIDCDETLDCLCLSGTIWLHQIDDILSDNIEDKLVLMCANVQD